MSVLDILQGAVRFFFRKTFKFWQMLGVHVTPVSFYQPIPDTRLLPEKLWNSPSQLAGTRMNEAGQLKFLELCRSRFKAEYDAFPREKTGEPSEYYESNGTFVSCDAEVLHVMIRSRKPRRIIEIGSGFSTILSARAILKNQAEEPERTCELTAIEPYPKKSLKAGFPGLSRLVVRPVQEVPLSEFEKLDENDILFIDSSHVVKAGSDAQYEFLEILPRLGPGVIVHVHDIFLPSEYPRNWILEKQRFWNEQYILQAFLTFNDAFEVLWAGSYMHTRHPETGGGVCAL